MISVFDMFKVGIGPSSSHTVGPMKAGKQFIDDLIKRNQFEQTTEIHVDVYGSLSNDRMRTQYRYCHYYGLWGYLPHNVDIDMISGFIEKVKQTRTFTH